MKQHVNMEEVSSLHSKKIKTWEMNMCLLPECLLHTVWGLLLSAVKEMPIIP